MRRVDEIGKLLALLHGARDRFHSMTATVRHWGARGEEVGHLWAEPPGRRRWELVRGDARTRARIVDGDRGWWRDPHGCWSPFPERAAVVPRWEYLVDPWPLVADMDLEPVGRVEAARRPAIRVRATARSIDLGWAFAEGRCELIVDPESGMLLRLEGQDRRSGESEGWEVVSVSFDDPLPGSLFALPPDAERDCPVRPREVDLNEAARLVSFTPFVPKRTPVGARRSVFYVPRRGAPDPREERVAIRYTTPDASHFLHLLEAEEEITMPEVEDWGYTVLEDVHDVGGRRAAVWRFLHIEGDVSTCRVIRYQQASTYLQVASELDLDTLFEIIGSLEPVPSDA